MTWFNKKDIVILLVCAIYFISCVEKYPIYKGDALVISQSISTRPVVSGCQVSYTINTTGVPNASAINGWIRSSFSSFAQAGTYLQFIERSSGSIILNVVFREQDALPYSTTPGVFSFKNYTLGVLDNNTLTLNRDYAWTESTIRKAVMYHLGLFLGMSPNQQDAASIMSPLLQNSGASLTTDDIANLKALYSATLPITLSGKNAVVNPRGTLFTVNFQNPKKFLIKDFGITWTDEFGNVGTGYRSLNNTTESIAQTYQVLSLQQNRAYTCRAYVQTECQVVYGTPFTIRTPASGSWNNLGNLPFSERKESTVITTNELWGNAFVIGGELAGGQKTNEMWQFSAQTNSWQSRKAFPGAVRSGAVGFAIGDKLYYGLGNVPNLLASQLRDWWEYDIATDQWTQKKDYPGALRSASSAFSFQTTGIVTLGVNWTSGGGNTLFGSYNRTTYRYTAATDTWSYVGDSPITTALPIGSFRLQGAGFLLLTNRELWRIDLQSASWNNLASLPTDIVINQTQPIAVTIGTSDAVAINNAGFFGLSAFINNANPSYSKQWWQYSMSNNSWTQLIGSTIDNRHSSIVFSLGEKIYILGGQRTVQGGTITNLKDWWEYNP
ncbi:Kelch repeat-containing protein [Runella sp.]|uniref:Kelch repeat-containing protein n=1 Tax=Runella sp. TaxID=1960881 RepID=UPI003D1386A6